MEPKYGLNLQPIDPVVHYVFGGYTKLGGEVLMSGGHGWGAYLPSDELQAFPTFDPMACTSYGTTNAVEVLLQHLGFSKNLSDRFLAKLSGTTTTGNDPHKVAETLRLQGTVDENLWPDRDATDWASFYADVPQSIQTLAKEFPAEFAFGHEWVPATPELLKQALQFSPLGISVFAWTQDANGLYFKPQGTQDNHWVVLYDFIDGQEWHIFDSYDQTHKKLRWDFQFQAAKRYSLSRQVVNNQGWFDFLINLLKAAFGIKTPAILQPMPSQPTPQPAHVSRITDWAKAVEANEGADPKSNNPGNLKYASLTASWGATPGRAASDGGHLCQFATYDQGFKALCNFLTLGAENQLIAFHNARTLQAFTVVYAGNPPQPYIDRIAAQLGVPLTIDVSELL